MNQLIEIKEADTHLKASDFPDEGFYLINKNCVFLVKDGKVYLVSVKKGGGFNL